MPSYRVALELGIFLLILSLIVLPLQEPGSASFIVNILALIVSASFVALVMIMIRRSARG